MPDLEPSDELDAWIVAAAPRALAYALSLVRHRAQAEDLVQDCFGRLLARSAEYDLPRDGDKLLFKSVSNACLNWLQRKPPEVALDVTELGGTTASPDRQAMHNELEQAMETSLQELSARQRALIELRSLGHSLAEVAEMLDLSHANARVQLHRARQALAEKLRPFLEEKRQ